MIIARLSLFALVACAALLASPAVAAEPALSGAELKAACKEARGSDYRLFLAPEVTRQGSTLAVSAVFRGPEAPWGAPLPLGCLKSWTVSDPKAATLSADHTRLTIAGEAAPGTKIRLSAEIDGKTAAIEFVVVEREAIVLTGYWSEVGDAACPAGNPSLRELHFLPDGRFEATWMPFETYVDYWGTYEFDPATGAISFIPTGGNHVPPDADLVGRAALGPDGMLRLGDIFFGTPRAAGATRSAAGCTLIFKPR